MPSNFASSFVNINHQKSQSINVEAIIVLRAKASDTWAFKAAISEQT
jgi:hypothetical protein